MLLEFDSIDDEEETPKGLLETRDVLNDEKSADSSPVMYEFDSIDDEEDPSTKVRVDHALSLSPEAHSRNDEVSKSTGVPVDVVERDDGGLERVTKANELKDALAPAPVLKSWFEKDDNARVSHDDIESLSNTEAVFKHGYSALDRGFTRVDQGYNYFVGEEAAEQTSDVEKSFLDILRDESNEGNTTGLYQIPSAFDLFNATERYATSRIFGKDEETAKRRFARAGELGRIIASIPKSPTATKTQDAIMEAGKEGFIPAVRAALEDLPGSMVLGMELGVEFAPQIATAAMVTATTRNPALGIAAMGGGSYGTERFSSPIEFLQKQGIELSDPKSLEKFMSDPALMESAQRYGIDRGSIIGLMDFISGGVASKALVNSPLGNMLLQMAFQAGTGGGGEALAMLKTEGRIDNWGEVVLEAIGEMATAPADVIALSGQYDIPQGLHDGAAKKMGNFNVTFGEKLKKSKIGTKILQQTVKFAESSKTRERSKEHYKNFIRTEAEKVGSDSVYIDPEGVEKLLQSSSPANPYDKTISPDESGPEITDEVRNNPTIKKILADIQAAKEEGRNIKIPLEEYLADIPGLDIESNIGEHAKIRNDLLTPNEEKNTDFEAESKKSNEEKTVQQIEEFEVHTDIVQKALDLGMPRSEATQNADYLALLLKRQADEEGISIKKLYDDNKLKTKTEIPGQEIIDPMSPVEMSPDEAKFIGKLGDDMRMDAHEDTSELEVAEVYNEDRTVSHYRMELPSEPMGVEGFTTDEDGTAEEKHAKYMARPQTIARIASRQKAIEQLNALRGKLSKKSSEDTLNQQAAEFGVAPEVLAKELEEAGGDITQTPRFKEWFGESKIVDGSGKPLVAYHGTDANITEFSNQTPGKRGFYFTTDLDKAETHRGKNNDWEAGSIMPVYLEINNPVVISDFTTWEKLKAQFTGEKLRASSEDGSLTTFLSDEQVDSYIAQGYDGIINEKGGEIIAFAPEQIKSVYNQGTFSSQTGEILKQSTPLSAQPIDDIMTTTVQQSSEALPSTGLLAGRMIKSMDQSIQELYQEEVNQLSDNLVEQVTGLKRADSTTSPSRFEGHIGSSQQIRYEIETMLDENGFLVPTPEYADKLRMAAAIKGYIQDQDAVVNSFLAPVADESQADVYAINVGRVLTHDEMVAVDHVIATKAAELGVDPEGIATPTTAEGVNLLNVSFGGINQLQLKEIYVSVSKELNAQSGEFGRNTLLESGYIGGFDGFKTGQEEYARIRDTASPNDSGTGNATEQWWGNADSVEQKRQEIRAYTEEFIGKHPLPTKTIRQIGEESDAQAKKEKRVIKQNDHSKKAHKSIVGQMFSEALAILKGGDKDASGWYTAKFQQALDDMAKKHPELAPGKDQSARDLYTTLVAITSDGAKVSINLRFADNVYEAYKKTGKVNTHIPSGERSASYKTNLDFLQNLIEEKGLAEAFEYLSVKQKVSTLEKEMGVKASGFSKTMELPRSSVFGPKLGMFWANLMGQPEWLTMDRWWSRTFNRYRGGMTSQPSKAAIENFKKLLGKPKAQAKTIAKEAKRITKGFAARRFKNGTPLEKAANIINKALTGLVDAPKNTKDRNFQFDVTDEVVTLLKEEGFEEMTISDLQAILWYGEKRRMREKGSKSPISEVDYSDVTDQVIAEETAELPKEDFTKLFIRTPWDTAIISGGKTLEMRSRPIPEKYVGVPIVLKNEKHEAVGEVVFSGSEKIESKEQFNSLRGQHQVPADSEFAFGKRGETHGWKIKSVKAYKVPQKLSPMKGQAPFQKEAAQFIKENNKANVLLQSEDGGTRGYFKLKTNEMTFTKGADLTTFIHEASHYFLSLLEKLKDGSPRIQAEMAILDKWYAENGAVTPVEKHEMFASGQEQYLMEGKAPTKELQRMFSRFKSWIKAVYERMGSSPFASNSMQGVELSDEVRGVFDRMLASDEAIAQARKEQSYDSMPLQEIGLDEKDYAEHQKLRTDAADEADADLTAQLIKDLKRQKAKWWRDEINPIIEEIGEKLSQQKDYVTRDWLTGQNIPDGGEPVKLNKAYIEEFYGKEAKADLKSMTSEDGINPEQLAEYFQYSSGDEMIQALLGTKKNAERKSYIRALAEQEMLSRHGDIMLDFGLRTDKANETVHNEKQAELLALELRMLNKKVGKKFATQGTPKDIRGVYKAAAEKTITEMTVGEMRPEVYLANERKHGRDAFKFAADQKWVEARDAKHKQIRQFYMYKEALKAKQKADKMAQRLRQWQVKKFDPKKVNPDFIKQVKDLITGIHFGKKVGEKRLATLTRETLEAWAEQQTKEYGASFHISSELNNAINKSHYGEMTFEELVGLHDTVKSIIAQGKKFSDIENALFAQLLEEGEESIRENATGEVVIPRNERTKDIIKSWGRFFMAEHRTAEGLSLELDGSEEYGGWVHKNVFLRLKHADDKYIDRSMKAGKELNEIFNAYTRKQKIGFFNHTYIPELGESLSLSGRLSFALNMGNAGNVDAMVNEYSEEQIEAVLDTLTDRDWDVVEALWENINQYWVEIEALEERTTGVKPAKVDAVPFTTSSGREIKGGYFPLVADPKRGGGSGKKDFEESQTLNGFLNKGRAKASTKHGSTIERVGFGQDRFVWLDLGVLFSHVDGVIKDIEMREAVAQTNRIIMSKGFNKAVSSAKGQEFHAVFEEWIKSVAGSHDQPVTRWDEFVVWARTGVSLTEMGFSPRTVLQQPFGLTQTVGLIGEEYTAKGVAEFMRDRMVAVEKVFSMSETMRNRGATFNRDVRDAHKTFGIKGLEDEIVTMAFSGIQMLDMAVSIPSWLGAYEKARSDGQNLQAAIDFADGVVTRGQGGGLPRNLSKVQNRRGVMRGLTMFYSFFNAYHNLQTNLVKGTNFRSLSESMRFARMQLWITVIPALAIDYMFNGGPDEGDDEGWMEWLFKTQAGYMAGAFIGVRDVANSALLGFDFQLSPAANVISMPLRFLEQSMQGDIDPALVKSGILAAGYLSRMPGGRAVVRIYDYLEEEGTRQLDEFEGWWRMLVQGKER